MTSALLLASVAKAVSDSPRPGSQEYFLSMATLISSRGTCPRRKVGCVLVNERRHVLATGYNGVPARHAHCVDKPCPGADLPSGTGLELCEAIHAEQNALLQCRNVHEIEECYTTASPCVACTKLLLNTSCRRIFFSEEYPHSAARDIWMRAAGQRVWEKVS